MEMVLVVIVVGFILWIGYHLFCDEDCPKVIEDDLCHHCHLGNVQLCNCGCVEAGYSDYVCSNPNCDGSEFEIIGLTN